MARKFKQGDEVSYVGPKTGKKIMCVVDGVATNGDVWVVWKDDESKVRQVKPVLLTLEKEVAPKPNTAQQKKPVYRWLCLECGAKHNARQCPRCDSDERIGNTDEDMDMSILAGGSNFAEPYSPGK